MAFDPDGEAQKGADNGSNPHNVQGLFVVHSPEDRGKHYSTDGSTGSYEADNASRVFSTYVRDNAKGTSLGTLDHDGRKNESDDSTGQALGEAKKNNHTAFEGKGGELPTKSAAHTIAGIVKVGTMATQTSCEEIHKTKDGGYGRSALGRLAISLLEVESGGVCHGDFDTEAIKKKQERIDTG